MTGEWTLKQLGTIGLEMCQVCAPLSLTLLLAEVNDTSSSCRSVWEAGREMCRPGLVLPSGVLCAFLIPFSNSFRSLNTNVLKLEANQLEWMILGNDSARKQSQKILSLLLRRHQAFRR